MIVRGCWKEGASGKLSTVVKNKMRERDLKKWRYIDRKNWTLNVEPYVGSLKNILKAL